MSFTVTLLLLLLLSTILLLSQAFFQPSPRLFLSHPPIKHSLPTFFHMTTKTTPPPPPATTTTPVQTAEGSEQEQEEEEKPRELSEVMKNKLRMEVIAQGGDPDHSFGPVLGNPILIISVIVAVLVALGGKGILF
eukprot:scaffold344_cov178-Ochromonas_danica.AAC.7